MTDARAFRGFRFPAEVILWAVRWYLQFPIIRTGIPETTVFGTLPWPGSETLGPWAVVVAKPYLEIIVSYPDMRDEF